MDPSIMKASNFFSPRVDKIADRELVGEVVGEPLGVQHQVVVQVTAVGAQLRHLLSSGLHHVGMAMTH